MRNPRSHALVPALLAATACALALAGEGPPAERARVAWSELSPHLAAGVSVIREASARWVFAPPTPEPDAHPTGADLPSIAAETLAVARDDIAWIVGEVATAGFEPPAGEPPPDRAVPLPQPVVARLFESGPFLDPLRRFADASLRARGISCDGCLADLRPSRDVRWRTVNDYLKAFIFVATVGETGMVDLRVGRSESALPPFEECNQDLAGAAYAMMQDVIRGSPAFQRAVETALNEELLSLETTDPVQARVILNRRVPDRLFENPAVRQEFLLRLPDSLDRHGLRCVDCPRPSPRF